MPQDQHRNLSRRERQIMDILLEQGRVGAEEVRKRLPEAPSYSAVRAMLVKLENKGQVRHAKEGSRYIYQPTLSRKTALSTALSRLVQVFFGGSVSQAVSGMVELNAGRMSEEELDRVAEVIEEARGRKRRQS